MRKAIRILIVCAFIVGFALVGIFGMLKLVLVLGGPNTVQHQGIVVGKFTDLSGGTTAYHFIVNESGTLENVQVDSLTFYTGPNVGESLTWTEQKKLPPDAWWYFVEVMVGIMGCYFVFGVMGEPWSVLED